MRANFVGNAVFLLLVLFFHAYSAFPSRPDERTLANNERYQFMKELLPALREAIVEDKFMEEKRNQEVMTAFNNMKELKDILRSG
ncbi:hypothetical protein Zmor_026108 [Zophobas morio]|uniref:Uncharacterized protein n=2 Tax=Zophobas morio TaxID=2755281 RepID=A0AA38HTF3_9CUCU|nr:hypothetical protein Zmor_026108 [Zophobas morio]